MGETTKIGWTDHTFNPWVGCSKVSEGCKHCYAEAMAKRAPSLVYGPQKGQGGPRAHLPVWGESAPRRVTSAKNWNEPLRWNRAARRYPDRCTKCGARLCMAAQVQIGRTVCPAQRDAAGKFDPSVPECGGEVARNVRPRVFCASLADVFEDSHVVSGDFARFTEGTGQTVPVMADLEDVRGALWPLIDECSALDFLLLTKRIENVAAMVPWNWMQGDWPAHVWLGFTAENQQNFDARWAHAKQIPASIIFASIEPQIGPVVLPVDFLARGPRAWAIVGGESGGGARPFDLAWARSIVAQCGPAGVPVFVKQMGARPVDTTPLLVAQGSSDFARTLVEVHNIGVRERQIERITGKGDNPAEWPADLRVQDFPGARP